MLRAGGIKSPSKRARVQLPIRSPFKSPRSPFKSPRSPSGRAHDVSADSQSDAALDLAVRLASCASQTMAIMRDEVAEASSTSKPSALGVGEWVDEAGKRVLNANEDGEDNEDDSNEDGGSDDEAEATGECVIDEEAFLKDTFYSDTFVEAPVDCERRKPPKKKQSSPKKKQSPPKKKATKSKNGRPSPKKKAKKETRPRQAEEDLWDPQYYAENVPKCDLPQVWADLGHKQFGGAGFLNWDYRDGKAGRENLDGTRIRKLRCTFHGVSLCSFVAREIYNPATETASIQICRTGHNDHSFIAPSPRKGLSKYIISKLFCSPCKLDSTLTKLCNEAQLDHGFAIGEKEKEQIKQFLRHHREIRHGDVGGKNTWGALRSVFKRYFKSNIADFTENSVHCFGFRADEKAGSLVAVISSEDLLLNMHRARTWQGKDDGLLHLCIDGSFRVTTEGFGLLPITTTNLKQQSKIIAYGIISTENEDDVRYIGQKTRDYATDILFSRFNDGIPVYN